MSLRRVTDLEYFIPRLYPQVKRDITQFAEEEVTLPRGPRRGMKFESDYMPFTKFIFDAIESKYWRRLAIVGPTQTGKSLICTNIPLLYYLFEQGEDLIFGIPNIDLAKGMWNEKIRPVIMDTIFSEYLPTAGAGSRGGVDTSVLFKNGSSLRFMGAGGNDAQRSSHTAKYIICSEIDKMDKASVTSKEADPVSQIMMRADSFEDSKIILECTVTGEQGRIWQEAMIHGSGGRVFIPCVKCGHYQDPVIEQLRYDDTDEISAEETARYECVECGELWTDYDRRESLETPLLVHKGQSIKNGEVVGELPRTRTFGMHYNIFHSPMQSLGKTAVQKRHADRSVLTDTKKAFIQSKLALPWKDEESNDNVLSVHYLKERARNSDCELGQVQHWAVHLIATVDVQKDWIYYHIDAWGPELQSQVVEYGVVDILEQSRRGLHKALEEVDTICETGFARHGDGVVLQPRLRLVDTGFRYDWISPWLLSHKKWAGVKGYGEGMKKLSGKKKLYEIPGVLQVRQQDDGNKMWFIWVDETKGIAQDRYFVEYGHSGYTYVPKDITQAYMMHLTAEIREYKANSDEFKWKKIRRRNDWLDCRSYSVAGATYLYIKIEAEKDVEKQLIAKRERANIQRQKRQQRSGSSFFNSRGRFFNG